MREEKKKKKKREEKQKQKQNKKPTQPKRYEVFVNKRNTKNKNKKVWDLCKHICRFFKRH